MMAFREEAMALRAIVRRTHALRSKDCAIGTMACGHRPQDDAIEDQLRGAPCVLRTIVAKMHFCNNGLPQLRVAPWVCILPSIMQDNYCKATIIQNTKSIY